MLAKLIYFRKSFTFKDLMSNNRWTHPNNLFAFGVTLICSQLPTNYIFMFYHFKPKKTRGLRDSVIFWGRANSSPYFLNFWTKIYLTIKLCRNNFQTLTQIWVGFLGVRFEVVVVGELSCLKLVTIMLETSNVAQKYKHM